MKTNRMNRILLLTALMGGMIAGCQPLEEIDSREIVDENAGKDGYTLTVEAVKKVDTKMLKLTDNGNKLDALWKNGEKVGVYVNGTYAGQLTTKTPTGNSDEHATLSGILTNAAGIAPGASIFLLYPDRDDIQEGTRWDYTGQTGYIQDASAAYDYATATLTVSGIQGNEVSTTGVATFQNEQSVYCFHFSQYITEFTIISNQNKLVTSRSHAGKWTSTFGPLTVCLPGAEGNTFFVSIRNENTTVTDTYFFLAMTHKGILYFGTKEIETQNLGNGKYLKPNVSLSQPDFTSIEGTYTGNIL